MLRFAAAGTDVRIKTHNSSTLQQYRTVCYVRGSNFVLRKAHGHTITPSNPGKSGVELFVGENRSSEVDRNSVESETLATIERCCVGRGEGELLFGAEYVQSVVAR